MTISAHAIRHIISGTSTHVRQQTDGLFFTLVCTVEEGVAVRFGGGSWNDPDLLPICESLMNGIGWKHVEYATGRQAVIRCRAHPENVAGAVCHIDLGDGWEPLPVREA